MTTATQPATLADLAAQAANLKAEAKAATAAAEAARGTAGYGRAQNRAMDYWMVADTAQRAYETAAAAPIAPVQAIPATTDEACQRRGATSWGCNCPDAQNRAGGSYFDAAGSRICKHIAHVRAQAAKAPVQAAAGPAAIDRLFGAAPKASAELPAAVRNAAGLWSGDDMMAACFDCGFKMPMSQMSLCGCCGDCEDARSRADLESSFIAQSNAEVKEMMDIYTQPEPVQFAMSPARARMLAALAAAEPVVDVAINPPSRLSRPIKFYSPADLDAIAQDMQEDALDDWQDFPDDPISYEPLPKVKRKTA